jgi:hypothetical protein
MSFICCGFLRHRAVLLRVRTTESWTYSLGWTVSEPTRSHERTCDTDNAITDAFDPHTGGIAPTESSSRGDRIHYNPSPLELARSKLKYSTAGALIQNQVLLLREHLPDTADTPEGRMITDLKVAMGKCSNASPRIST